MRVGSVLRLLACLALLVLVVATVESYHASRMRETALTVQRVGLEDVARRVRTCRQNLKAVRELASSVDSAKAKAFLDEAKPLTDVAEIARTSRIGMNGRVSIVPSAGLPPPERAAVSRTDEKGRKSIFIETDCDGYRIRVSIPDAAGWLGAERRFHELVVIDLILLLIVFLAAPTSRQILLRDASALKALYGGRLVAKGSLGRTIRHPVTITCAIAFVLATSIAWLVMSHTSLADAKSRLLASAADMRRSVDACADNLLFYQGNAIVNHYKSPESMTVNAIRDVMRRYGLDELNIVDGHGIVLAGDLAVAGYDMSSNTNSAKFNCLLAGAKTYSQDFRAPIENPTGERRKYAGIAFPRPAKGYIQIGFDESRMKHDIDFWFHDLALDWHIGERGYYIVADAETGDVVSCGRSNDEGETTFTGGLTLAVIGFDVQCVPKSPNVFFEANIFGEKCLCLSEVRGYHRIVSVIPFSEIHGSVRQVILLAALVMLVVFVIVILFTTKLTDLVTSLRGYIAREKANNEKDLAVARTIQTSSLPIAFPDEPGWRLAAKMKTAREVGGDFFDFYHVPSGRFFFLIADVSGKGIPAAMFMMKAKAIIHACADRASDLSVAITAANDALSENNDADMFVTAWFGLIDFATGKVEYVNAGHNPPLVRRADGSSSWVRGKRSLALGAMGGVTYAVERLTLAPGDSLFLYTDGVTEAMNAAGELYGEERLERIVRSAGADIIPEVQRDVDAFVAGAEQSDDITMLALDLKKQQQ